MVDLRFILHPHHCVSHQITGRRTAPCRPGATIVRLCSDRCMQIPPKSKAQFWMVVASAGTTRYSARSVNLSGFAFFQRAPMCPALRHSLDTLQNPSFPPLNLHSAASPATTGGFLHVALSNAHIHYMPLSASCPLALPIQS